MSQLSESNLWSMTVPMLRDLMRSRGVAPLGATRKADLIARILESQGQSIPLSIVRPAGGTTIAPAGAGSFVLPSAPPVLNIQRSAEAQYEEEFASEQVGDWETQDLDEMDLDPVGSERPVEPEPVQVNVIPVPPAPELPYRELPSVPSPPEETEPLGTPVPAPTEDTFECIVCYDQKVSKKDLLVCGHPICVDCLSLLRRPICPADQTPLRGPLLTPDMMKNIHLRQREDEKEEEKRNQLISQAVALNPGLRPEDLYGQEIPAELLQAPQEEEYEEYAPIPPQLAQFLLGALGGGGMPIIPPELSQIIFGNLRDYYQQGILTDENIQLLAQQINLTYPGYGLNNIIDDMNRLLPEVLAS